MTRKTKEIPTLGFLLSTVKRLAKPENGPRLRAIFESLPPEFAPTHAYERKARISLEDLEHLPIWSSPGGGNFKFHIGTALNGYITFYATFPTRSANYIYISLDIEPLVTRGLLANALQMFEALLAFASSPQASVSLGARESKDTWIQVDVPQPDFSVKPAAWNGVEVGSTKFATRPGLDCLEPLGGWINVIGPEYVELIGRDKLHNLDVFSKREDAEGRIWLQMSEHPEKMHLPEMKTRAAEIVASLGAPDVFCRLPRTQEERQKGIDPKSYRTPDFDWSELRDDDPYSTRWYGFGVGLGGESLQVSHGSCQVVSRPEYRTLLDAVFRAAFRRRGHVEPFGIALAELPPSQIPAASGLHKSLGLSNSGEGELVQVQVRSPKDHTPQMRADLVVEGMVKEVESRKIKATAVCFHGNGRVPGENVETEEFRVHLERANGEAYVVHLPVKEGRKREYGILVVEPAKPIIFDAPASQPRHE